MTRHILFRAAGVLILIAAQQTFADSISCSFTGLNNSGPPGRIEAR
jgi:hypothetical protein